MCEENGGTSQQGHRSEEVAHASRNVTNLLPFSIPEESRCHLIPVLSGLQECNYVTLQYKQVMTRAQPPLVIDLFYGIECYTSQMCAILIIGTNN